VHVHVTDGRLFLKTTASTFDVIIVICRTRKRRS